MKDGCFSHLTSREVKHQNCLWSKSAALPDFRWQEPLIFDDERPKRPQKFGLLAFFSTNAARNCQGAEPKTKVIFGKTKKG